MVNINKTGNDGQLQKCSVCNGDITEKPVKKMGNFYCSVYCAEVNRERMENLDMEKLDFNELGEVVGKFMNTCQKCVMPIQCRKVRSYCASYFDVLHESASWSVALISRHQRPPNSLFYCQYTPLSAGNRCIIYTNQ